MTSAHSTMIDWINRPSRYTHIDERILTSNIEIITKIKIYIYNIYDYWYINRYFSGVKVFMYIRLQKEVSQLSGSDKRKECVPVL